MNQKTKFADLFSGIGGFHIAFSNLGAECALACEKDKQARMTYQQNFDIPESKFYDDIRTLDLDNLEDFDVLCAGFPCQSFSIAGNRKGFNDTTKDEKGQMFFYLLNVIKKKKPKAFLLENVKGLLDIDNGETFKTIESLLKKEGYSFYYKLMKACDYGVPQLRPRVFMVGFLNDSKGEFEFPKPVPLEITMSDIWGGKCHRDIGLTICASYYNQRKRPGKHPWDLYYVDGQERRLGIKEAKIMQGFPSDYEFPVKENKAVMQLGNAVCVPVVQMTGEKILSYLQEIA